MALSSSDENWGVALLEEIPIGYLTGIVSYAGPSCISFYASCPPRSKDQPLIWFCQCDIPMMSMGRSNYVSPLRPWAQIQQIVFLALCALVHLVTARKRCLMSSLPHFVFPHHQVWVCQAACHVICSCPEFQPVLIHPAWWIHSSLHCWGSL